MDPVPRKNLNSKLLGFREDKRVDEDGDKTRLRENVEVIPFKNTRAGGDPERPDTTVVSLLIVITVVVLVTDLTLLLFDLLNLLNLLSFLDTFPTTLDPM